MGSLPDKPGFVGGRIMDITQTFYDNMASQYDKLFLDWNATTQEQAVIMNKIFIITASVPVPISLIVPAGSEHRQSVWRLSDIR